jgi:uncharacterized protein (DUF1499 family)
MEKEDMTTTSERKPSVWAARIGWLAVAALAFTLLMLALAGPGYRVGLLELSSAFSLFRLAAYGAVASLFLGLLALGWNLAGGTRNMAMLGMLALVVGGALTWNFYRWLSLAQEVPPIHDISTDVEEPPAFRDAIAERERTGAANPPEYAGEEVARQQQAAYPDIVSLEFEAPPEEVFDAALGTVQSMGWELIAEAPEEGRIEATDTTAYFGFRDDVVIRVRETGGATRLDIRSKSRVGRSDVGTNAKRIREFRDEVSARIG